jgi:hypothetical protein
MTEVGDQRSEDGRREKIEDERVRSLEDTGDGGQMPEVLRRKEDTLVEHP